MKKETCGIYCIRNLVNGKRYIGKYKGVIKYRISDHFSKLRKNKHSNKYLQTSWNKYGESNFEYFVVKMCDEKDLSDKEIYYIKKYKSNNSLYGYNLTNGGEGFPSRKGKPLLDETKLKLSKIMTGRYTGNKNPFFGKKHSTNKRKELSERKKKWFDSFNEEEKTRIRKRLNQIPKGTFYYTDETYKKLSESHRGENSATSKLTEKDVISILTNSESYGKIASKYKISFGQISRIKNGTRWSYLKERYPELYEK